jgi:hypothetical protein
LKNETENILLVLMGERSNSRCDEKILKLHSFS